MQEARTALGACAVAGIILVAVLGSQIPAGAVAQARALTDGVFTKDQAERGAKLYRQACAECHQAAEFDGYLRAWVGLPVSFLFDAIRTQMPEDNPGGLSRDEYADVLTYLFEINGLPAGDAEMESTAQVLESITIAVGESAPELR